ncbi:MAG TPA: winged helix family transcriptional regulator, partial [Microbacterium sp.]|nr:winged helix family transcriptional regulator [Microbacterium sp.]
MSNIAIIDRPTARPALRLVPDLPEEAPAAEANLPTGATPRGFALYVGFDEQKAAASGISLGRIVEELRRALAAVAPDAETYATVALAPAGAGGRD